MDSDVRQSHGTLAPEQGLPLRQNLTAASVNASGDFLYDWTIAVRRRRSESCRAPADPCRNEDAAVPGSQNNCAPPGDGANRRRTGLTVKGSGNVAPTPPDSSPSEYCPSTEIARPPSRCPSARRALPLP